MLRICFPKERKKEVSTSYAPLCAFGQYLLAEGFFIPFYAATNHLQKTLVYRPMDKVLALLVSEMCGSQTVIGVNYTVKPDAALATAWGLDKCPDQSTISLTIEAFDTEACDTFQFLVNQQFVAYSPLRLKPNEQEIIDIDLSPIVVCGKQMEGAKKGYKARVKNKRLRQVVRIFAPSTREIIYDWIVPGNFVAENVIKAAIAQFEYLMNLSTSQQRQRFILRLDSGFGSDACINWLMSRGYHLLTKMKSGRRANKLGAHLSHWEDAPSLSGQTDRRMAQVMPPKRYCRKTEQLVVRFKKQDGSFSHQVLVTSLTEWEKLQIVRTYDQRVTIESSFSQDKQGLGLARRKKKTMLAQQVLLCINQLAHNLLVWFKEWMLQQGKPLLSALDLPTVESGLPLPEGAGPVVPDEGPPLGGDKPGGRKKSSLSRFIRQLSSYGIVRLMGQIVKISGTVSFSGRKVTAIKLNPLHPQTKSVTTCLSGMLGPIKIPISLDEK